MTDDLETRVQACAEMLRAYCEAHGVYRSPDDRVSEEAAAGMLGVEPRTLANARSANKAPKWYRPRVGCAVTYRITEVARFIESSLVQPDSYARREW